MGPDVVIIGAARSGTSFLSATLGRHPQIDAGSVKEPNYYSSRWSEGPDWYENLYQPRELGLRRVDASVSYTYPQHPSALERVREANPDVLVVYTVREPLARLVSHYQLFRYYYDQQDKWRTLQHAMERSDMFLGSGDYGTWLQRVDDLFDRDQVLVVPFPATTKDVESTARLVLGRLGVEQTDLDLAAPDFRNEVRDFRVPALRIVQERMRKGKVYPALRRFVGPERLRAWRQRLTKPMELPPVEAELAALDEALAEEVRRRSRDAVAAVDAWLPEQDARTGLAWTPVWHEHVAGAPRF